MSPLSATFGWCVLQVTVLCLAALMVSAGLRWFSAGVAATCVRTAVLGVIALTALTALPGRSWLERSQPAAATIEEHPAHERRVEPVAIASPHVTAEPASSEATPPALDPRELWTRAGETWSAFVDELQPAEPTPLPVGSNSNQSLTQTWMDVAAGACLVGIAIGVLRFLIGWLAMRRQVRRARQIDDAAVSELVDVLSAALTVRQSIVLRETADLTTAATVGWRRPVILLPLEWRVWTRDQLRAVLAHELAHIAARHFPQWIVAQAALTLHFYHPLVHWLTARLRLEQEYEADGRAASLTGGARTYLETLAALAIRQADEPVGWPARAFLPTRRTFLRRIEMLRGATMYRTASLPMRLTAACLVVAAGVFAAGVRAPAGEENTSTSEAVPSGGRQPAESPRNPFRGSGRVEFVQADPAAAPAAPAPVGTIHGINLNLASGADDSLDLGKSTDPKLLQRIEGPIELAWIPGDAIAVVAARPHKLLNAISKDNDLRRLLPLLEQLVDAGTDDARLLLHLTQSEQVTLVLGLDSLSPVKQGQAFPRMTTIVRFLSADHKAAFLKDKANSWTIPGEPKAFAGASYRLFGETGVYEPDELTVLLADEAALQRMILSGPRVRSRLVAGGGGHGSQTNPVPGPLSGAAAPGATNREPLGLSGGSFLGPADPSAASSLTSASNSFGTRMAGGPSGMGGMGYGTSSGTGWEALTASSHVALAVDLDVLNRLLPTDVSPVYAPFTPLWTSSERAYLGLQVGEGKLRVLQSIHCNDEKGAVQVRRTLDAMLVLAQNSLAGFQRQLPRIAIEEQGRPTPQEAFAGSLGRLTDASSELLNGATVSQQGDTVSLRAEMEIEPSLVLMLTEGVSNARAQAGTEREQNSLRQVAIAFHNYHDAYGRFPPAVVIDPKSNVARSWRVELLPFLGRADLYEKYRKDLPWDSDENRAVLDAAPEVFRQDGSKTSILAVVGPGTVFDGPQGSKLATITDGTSNTILVVQHPTMTVPWTKPEDVNIAHAEWPVKFTHLGDLLKGDFNVALCDGRVARVAENPDAKQLARWLVKGDGFPAQSIFSDSVPTNRRPLLDEAPIMLPGTDAGGAFPPQEEDSEGGAGASGDFSAPRVPIPLSTDPA